MKNKIALFVAELDVRGGTHKQLLKLCEYLQSKEYDLKIYTPIFDIDKTYPEFKNFNIVSLRQTKCESSRFTKLTSGLLDQLRLFLMSKNSEIVNIHDINSTFFILLHVIFGKAKLLWQINDLDPAFSLGNFKDCKSRLGPLRRFFSRLAAKHVDQITVNVTKNAIRVREHLNRHSEVVYCGVDFLKKRKAIPTISKEIRLVSTGVVFRYRNYETLIKAAAYLKKEGINALVSIVGDTRYDIIYVDELKALAKDLNVHVSFFGSVEQDKLNEIYESSHIFAFLNIDQSWGLAVFEAASLGLPIVLSESVGAVELLKGKPGVCIVDPQSPTKIATAMLQIISDVEKYSEVCNSVSLSVMDMSWDKMYSTPVEKILSKLAKV